MKETKPPGMDKVLPKIPLEIVK